MVKPVRLPASRPLPAASALPQARRLTVARGLKEDKKPDGTPGKTSADNMERLLSELKRTGMTQVRDCTSCQRNEHDDHAF